MSDSAGTNLKTFKSKPKPSEYPCSPHKGVHKKECPHPSHPYSKQHACHTLANHRYPKTPDPSTQYRKDSQICLKYERFTVQQSPLSTLPSHSFVVPYPSTPPPLTRPTTHPPEKRKPFGGEHGYERFCRHKL